MHQFTNTYCLLAAGFLRIVDGQKLEQAIDERSQEGDCDCNVCVSVDMVKCMGPSDVC